MTSNWSTYPASYRSSEVQLVLQAVLHGDCAAVVGLSGAGKSNLLGFVAHRAAPPGECIMVDCNRLPDSSPAAFWQLLRFVLANGVSVQPIDDVEAVESSLSGRLESPHRLCLVFDRFEAVPIGVHGSLRALRDEHKYALTYLVACRRPLDPRSELAELFYAHTIWLGPLSDADARWSIAAYADRARQSWSGDVLDRLIDLSGGYPSLLRAACEAYASGCPLDIESLQGHPAVARRLEEFWADRPTPQELKQSRLDGIALLAHPAAPVLFDESSLTAAEARLWGYLKAHPGQVCEKDDLIRAVWPEDKVWADGIRDDSLAQLVRRLRVKAPPGVISTIPGRGYQLRTVPGAAG